MFQRGDIALFFEMASTIRKPLPIRPVVVLHVWHMKDIRYSILFGTDKLSASVDELFKDEDAVEVEKIRRKILFSSIEQMIRK